MAIVIYLTNGERVEVPIADRAEVLNTDHGHVLVCTDAQGRERGRFRWDGVIGCTSHPDPDLDSEVARLLDFASKEDVLASVNRVALTRVPGEYPQ